MKNLRIALILLLTICVGYTNAQDQRTLRTKLVDILNLVPAEDPGQLDKIMKETVALGEPGYTMLLGRLTPDGDASDTRHRYLIEGLSRYITSASDQEEYNTALISNISDSGVDASIRIFLLERMLLTAQENNLNSFLGFMEDADLFEASIRNIVALGNKDAIEPLFNSLEKHGDNGSVEILKALAALGMDSNISGIIEFLNNNAHPSYLQPGMQLLANSGKREAMAYLLTASSNSNLTKLKPSGYLLQLAEKAFEKGDKELADDIVANILSSGSPDHVKTRAYHLEARMTENKAKLNKKLIKEFTTSTDNIYRNSLLEISESLELVEAKSSWRKAYAKTSENGKINIIQHYRDQKNGPEIHYVREHLSGLESKYLILEIMKALAAVEGNDAIGSILLLMQNKQYSEMGRDVLLTIAGNDQLSMLADKLPSITDNSKVALMQVIAQKRGFDYFDQIFEYTSNTNEDLSKAAYEALPLISRKENLEVLGDLYSKASGDNRVSSAQAVIAAAQDIEDQKERDTQLLAILGKSRAKGQLIRLLPQVASPAIFDQIIDYYNGTGSTQNYAFTALSEWPNSRVTPVLFSAYTEGDTKFHARAFHGLIRLAQSPEVPQDQRLLMLRKLMDLVSTSDEKKQILRACGLVRSPISVVYLSNYLNDPELGQIASRSLVNASLPKPQDKEGLYGKIIRKALHQSMEVMEGPEVQYLIADIADYLSKMPDSQGYISMFNGKDLTGWKGYVDNPIRLKSMRSRDLVRRQADADRAINKNWGVKDGMITFSGDGQNLLSVKEYGDFEMYCDWKISKHGDSGIYLRGTPQVQIWDTSRVDVGAQVGSGGLYNNQKNPSKPLTVADNPIGEWNTFYIRMIGEKVTVKLNGVLVVDDVPLENYWNRNQPIFPVGTIELQAHGTDLAFRDIYVNELSSPDFSLTSEEKKQGFVSLFNGKDLEGWVGNKTDYTADRGTILVNPKAGGHGNLYTANQYSNFNFRFEFQLTPGANNGLGIHTPLEGDAAYVGKELQILDNTASIYANLKEYQYHGSVYGVVAAKRGHLKPVGEWNEQEVIVQGNRIRVILNGDVIVDADYVAASRNGTLDGRDHPGLNRKMGHIGFLGHGSVLRFRNIRVKKL